ncbi:hypothetical protein LPMP_211580 [Leishmania panamensis]|uniref:Uncharacterized protein n=1 Tax=Leishmania panamensis TaxID=5679 RepID=A0A088S9D2_LEIPA|nr:hypothetical protein LPMP_211580 [Leishmania panamensis]AIN98236.1 hypothetical protein LPMP_211580 [Leishmania panamensis]
MVAPLSAALALGSPGLRGGSFNHTTISSRATTATCRALLVAVLIFMVAPSGAQGAVMPASFRCLRPFSATDTFSNVAKAQLSQNCDYFYFTVEDAKAELKCASSSAAATVVSDDISCSVTVRWSMRRASDVTARLQRQVGTDKDYFVHDASTASTATLPTRTRNTHQSARVFLTEDDDVWRYTVSLKAKGDSSIHYKGFSKGNGYSLCCNALEEADCAWMTLEKGDNDLDCDEAIGSAFASQSTRTLRSCPLPLPALRCAAGDVDVDDDCGAWAGAGVVLTDLDEDEDSGVFHGVLTKPLHRIVEGPWEVVVQLWRRRQWIPSNGAKASYTIPTDESVEAEVLGRIVVPFTLNVADLQGQGRITHVPSMALTVEDTAEVVMVADEKPAVEAGDL